MSSDHPRLEDWQWNGDRLDGLVYGKPGVKDGTPMTTSEVPEAQRFADHVVTSSGSTYVLGAPSADQQTVVEAYETLGLPKTATAAEIEQKYKQLQWTHPNYDERQFKAAKAVVLANMEVVSAAKTAGWEFLRAFTELKVAYDPMSVDQKKELRSYLETFLDFHKQHLLRLGFQKGLKPEPWWQISFGLDAPRDESEARVAEFNRNKDQDEYEARVAKFNRNKDQVGGSSSSVQEST